MQAQKKQSLIYLTGFMGSGKSTIAPILANTIGYTFLDIDKAIEEETGKKVTDIFFQNGEAYFRDAEERILRAASLNDHTVVSLGGGTLASESNFLLVKSSGILIYLKTDIQQIFRRVKFKQDRPLLLGDDGKQLSDAELLKRIESIFAAREPFYNRADIIIETSGRRVGLTVDHIVRTISSIIA